MVKEYLFGFLKKEVKSWKRSLDISNNGNVDVKSGIFRRVYLCKEQHIAKFHRQNRKRFVLLHRVYY
jgi:hypothetical protein